MSTPPVKPRKAAPRKSAAATRVAPAVAPTAAKLADEPVAASLPTTKPVVAATPDVTQTPPSAEPAASSQPETIMNETVKTFADTAKKTTDETVARTQAGVAEFNDRAKGAMERGQRVVEEMNDFSKGNLEAIVESSKIAAKHAEAFGQHAAEFGRKSYEQASSAMQQFAGVKSPTDFFRLQSEFARQAFDQVVAESSRNSELALKAAGEVFQPLSNRFAVAAEKIKVVA